MDNNYVPIVLFVVIGVVVALNYYFNFRSRAEMQQTVRTALDRGAELSPELVDQLGASRRSPLHDLRRGVIAIFLAAGIAVFGLVLDEQDAVRPFLAISVLPLAVGIAYILLWLVDKSRNET